MEPQPQVPVVTFSGMYPFGDFPSWPSCDVLESSREPSCVVQTKGLASGEYERLVLLCSPRETARQAFRFVQMRVQVLPLDFGPTASCV